MTDTTDRAAELPGTLDDAAVAALTGWMRDQGLGSSVTGVEPLAGGTQNIVVRLRIDDRRLVLRRPPPHPRANSNRTMQREIAVLRTLSGSCAPHPEFFAACEDLDVLGVVFYLMEDVDGFNPATDVAPAYADPSIRHRVGLNYAAALAGLHRSEWRGRPLQDLQRPGSFLARQVPGFLTLLESYRHKGYRPESLEVGRLAQWLEEHRPPDAEPGIMHGDAHLNNTLLRRDVPQVAAFVDWEMCTIGDPMLDLGWILVCWPHDPDPINAGRALAGLGGLPSRTELVEAYIDAGGRSTEHLPWYIAMACFKLAIVIEGTYSRYLAGLARREAGERLHDSASRLIGLGMRVATGDSPFT